MSIKYLSLGNLWMVCRGFIRGRSTNFRKGWLGQLSEQTIKILWKNSFIIMQNYTEKEVATVHLAHFKSPQQYYISSNWKQ